MPAPSDETVRLPGGPRLAVRRHPGTRRPFLLVHGLASNARLWDGVAERLAAAGHPTVAVDLRGHGRSEQTADGYRTEVAADDLAALVAALGLRAPVVAGQSWGGNVVLQLAARHGLAAAVALVDGGWLRLRERFPTFEQCWAELAPPRLDGVPRAVLEPRLREMTADWPAAALPGVLANFTDGPDGTLRPRLARAHHREILRSLWEGDPRPLYPAVRVPVTLLVAGDDAAKRAAVQEALAALPDAQVRWYAGAHHDLHAQQPDRCARDLLDLAERAGP